MSKSSSHPTLKQHKSKQIFFLDVTTQSKSSQSKCQQNSVHQNHTIFVIVVQLILTLLLCLRVYDENAAVWKLLINISYKFCQSQHIPQTTAHSATIQ